MPRIAREQCDALLSAIRSHEFLSRIVEAIEHHHRLVFHADEGVDWNRLRKSAEQILVAEIVTRYKSNIDGVYFALRRIEASGKPWPMAIHDLAGSMHSYYTTPLGIVMRKDLFGDDATFIAADAGDWMRQQEGTRTSGRAAES